MLRGVACIVLDEFHERSIDMDLCLTLCRNMQLGGREQIRLVLMSATFGDQMANQASRLLGDCPVIRSDGRSFPVQTRYSTGPAPLRMIDEPTFGMRPCRLEWFPSGLKGHRVALPNPD